MTLFEDVIVTFGKELQCVLAPEYLVKVKNFLPGDMVKLVDDFRGEGNLKLQNGEQCKSATEVCGNICLVLDNCIPDTGVIYVTLGEEYNKFSPFHLDFVARPLYGDLIFNVCARKCGEGI